MADKKEYIERGALIAEYDRVHVGAPGGARKLMVDAPAADVVEVRHGHWIIKIDEYDNEYVMCSCCKDEFYPADEDTIDMTPNYCPNCGAKMDGGKEQA